MDKLQELIKRCKCGVHLSINMHRDMYHTVPEHLEEWELFEKLEDLDADVRAKMIETNTIVDLQFYPDTPIGFFNVVHYDVDLAIDQALECLS